MKTKTVTFYECTIRDKSIGYCLTWKDQAEINSINNDEHLDWTCTKTGKTTEREVPCEDAD